jgi:DNA-directed RNA polymerase specialized sigma24 family protein
MTRDEKIALAELIEQRKRFLDRVDLALAAQASTSLTERQWELWLEVQVLGRPATVVAAERGVSKVAVSKTVTSACRNLQAARLRNTPTRIASVAA